MAAAKRFFKIRHKDSGLYSKGGGDAAWSINGTGSSWTLNGKIWAGTGPLRSHLTQVLQSRSKPDISKWEIVELALTEISKTPATEMVSQEQLLRMLK